MVFFIHKALAAALSHREGLASDPWSWDFAASSTDRKAKIAQGKEKILLFQASIYNN